MARHAINEEGKRYGTWTVLFRVANNKGGAAMWRCVCDCGTVREVPGIILRSGRSAGCRDCYDAKRQKKLSGKLTTADS